MDIVACGALVVSVLGLIRLAVSRKALYWALARSSGGLVHKGMEQGDGHVVPVKSSAKAAESVADTLATR